MDAADLYGEIKAALTYFGLRFNEMDKVKVTRTPNALVFRYGEATVSFLVPDEGVPA